MSDLIVIGYEDQQKAEGAYQQVMDLSKDFIVDLKGLALITVDADGKKHVDTPSRLVGRSAASGALWGALLGLLFLVPGMVLLGGALGALFGKLGQSGIDDRFRSQVSDLMTPGHSAVVIMAGKVTEDKFGAAMAPYGGQILKTSLSDADEKELAEELAV